MTTYNKSEIMKRAWNQYRFRRHHFWLNEEQKTFGNYLKDAWKNARREATEEAKRKERAEANTAMMAAKEAKEARAVAAMTDTNRAKLAEIDKQLFNIDMIDRWSDADRQSYYRLQGERERLIAANSGMQTMVNEAKLKEVA